MWALATITGLIFMATLSMARRELSDDELMNYKHPFVYPLKRCACPSKAQSISPGIGFALEMSYGTVSVKYDNGTFSAIAKIPASAAYIALMQDFATNPIKKMHDGSRPPPGVDEDEKIGLSLYLRFLAKRFIRKLLWLPATADVKILAEMVSQLRREAEAHLGHRVKGAALASPDRVRLRDQEIKDIFDCLRMEDLMADKNDVPYNVLTSMAAASAGYGDGLCENYTNAYECALEENRNAPYLEILQLEYSRHVLTAALGGASTARRSYCGNVFVDFELGSSQILHDEDRREQYWIRVEKRIRDFAGSSRLDRLMLTGESASDTRFVEAVKNALSRTVVVLPLGFDIAERNASEHFLFATSFGAAEFAKRRLEGMQKCLMPVECRQNSKSRGAEKNEL